MKNQEREGQKKQKLENAEQRRKYCARGGMELAAQLAQGGGERRKAPPTGLSPPRSTR